MAESSLCTLEGLMERVGVTDRVGIGFSSALIMEALSSTLGEAAEFPATMHFIRKSFACGSTLANYKANACIKVQVRQIHQWHEDQSERT